MANVRSIVLTVRSFKSIFRSLKVDRHDETRRPFQPPSPRIEEK